MQTSESTAWIKTSTKAWFEKLHSALLSFGSISAKSDQSLFVKVNADDRVYLLVYVDDIVVTDSNQKAIDRLINNLNKAFALKDLGHMNYFLGKQVSKLSDGSIHLSQRKYAIDLLSQAKMQYAKGVSTHMNSGQRLITHGNDPISNTQLYRSVLGALQYTPMTRSKITYSFNKVCQYMQNPLVSHWQAVKRIVRYLAGTLDLGLIIQSNPSSSMILEGFCDADWASEPDDRRSTSSFCAYLNSNLVSWQSKKQQVVSRSTTKTEYRSLAHVVAELTWISPVLSKLNFLLSRPSIVGCDNLSTVMLSANPIHHARISMWSLICIS